MVGGEQNQCHDCPDSSEADWKGCYGDRGSIYDEMLICRSQRRLEFETAFLLNGGVSSQPANNIVSSAIRGFDL